MASDAQKDYVADLIEDAGLDEYEVADLLEEIAGFKDGVLPDDLDELVNSEIDELISELKRLRKPVR